MGWLEGWQYRKSHVIEGSPAGAVADYQVRIVAHYGSGSDSGEDVYLNGHARVDFGDVRFTLGDGETVLDYWLEEVSEGDYAVFWVKIPSVPASPDAASIYIYYGKEDAVSISNGFSTFLQFDDFNDGVIGAEWTKDEATSGAVTEADGILTIYEYEHCYSHLERGLDLNSFEAHVKIKIDDRYAGQTWGPGLGVYWSYNTWVRAQYRWFGSPGECRIYFDRMDSGAGSSDYLSVAEGVWRYFKLAVTPTTIKCCHSTDGITWSQLGGDYARPSSMSGAPSLIIIGKGFGSDAYANPDWDNSYSSPGTRGYSYLDDYFLRSYIDPEPEHGSWGAEETAAPPEEVKPLYYIEYGLLEQIVSMVYALVALVVLMMAVSLSVRKLK